MKFRTERENTHTHTQRERERERETDEPTNRKTAALAGHLENSWVLKREESEVDPNSNSNPPGPGKWERPVR